MQVHVRGRGAHVSAAPDESHQSDPPGALQPAARVGRGSPPRLALLLRSLSRAPPPLPPQSQSQSRSQSAVVACACACAGRRALVVASTSRGGASCHIGSSRGACERWAPGGAPPPRSGKPTRRQARVAARRGAPAREQEQQPAASRRLQPGPGVRSQRGDGCARIARVVGVVLGKRVRTGPCLAMRIARRRWRRSASAPTAAPDRHDRRHRSGTWRRHRGGRVPGGADSRASPRWSGWVGPALDGRDAPSRLLVAAAVAPAASRSRCSQRGASAVVCTRRGRTSRRRRRRGRGIRARSHRACGLVQRIARGFVRGPPRGAGRRAGGRKTWHPRQAGEVQQAMALCLVEARGHGAQHRHPARAPPPSAAGPRGLRACVRSPARSARGCAAPSASHRTPAPQAASTASARRPRSNRDANSSAPQHTGEDDAVRAGPRRCRRRPSLLAPWRRPCRHPLPRDGGRFLLDQSRQCLRRGARRHGPQRQLPQRRSAAHRRRPDWRSAARPPASA